MARLGDCMQPHLSQGLHANLCKFLSKLVGYTPCKPLSTGGCMQPLCKPLFRGICIQPSSQRQLHARPSTRFVWNPHASPPTKWDYMQPYASLFHGGYCETFMQVPFHWDCTQPYARSLPFRGSCVKAPLWRSDYFMQFLAKKVFELDPTTTTPTPCGGSWQKWHFCAEQNISCNW